MGPDLRDETEGLNFLGMRYLGVLVFWVILMGVPQVLAAEDIMTRAMRLYEKRHYHEAARTLRAEGAFMESSKKGSLNLALGMIYFKNAMLHREFYQAGVATSLDYLKKLSATQGEGRSRFVDLYLGEALVESGKPRAAATHLKRFSQGNGVEPRYRAIAKVCLGLADRQDNGASKGTEFWGAIDTSDLEVMAELAAATSKAGLKDKDPSVLAESILSELKRSGKSVSMRMVKNLAALYARGSGSVEKGLDLLDRSDLKAFSYREVLGKSKVIHFYDLSLLNDMATLHGRASVAFLEKAAGAPEVRDAAEFYLGQAYAMFGSIERSSKVIASFTASAQMPQQYKDRIRVVQGANLCLRNHQTEAVGIWDELLKKQPGDPDLIIEILLACNRTKVECPQALQKAILLVEAGGGKKLSSLNMAIGKYLLSRREDARAVSYLEAGRDKSHKNKIESNDPAMLVSLADAYYRTKKFSEALEIYFEMSKYFPEVRQIQEAMQGVYAIEHKSAGDVKIN
jgi:tetratricopeptide (TPR) repeat protein